MKFIERFDPLHTMLKVNWHPEYQRKISEPYVKGLQAAIRAGDEIQAVSLARFPNGEYAVLDGQHRIEAAKREKTWLSANVFELEPDEAPAYFLKLNTLRRVGPEHKVFVHDGIVSDALRTMNVEKDGPLTGRIVFDAKKQQDVRLSANQLVQTVHAYFFPDAPPSNNVEAHMERLRNASAPTVYKVLEHIAHVVYDGKGAVPILPRGALVALGLLAAREGFKPSVDFLRVYRTKDWKTWQNGQYGAGAREAIVPIADQFRTLYRGRRS